MTALSASTLETALSSRTDSPLFSVIVPTCNRAALLPNAVGSILAQTFPDYELILVDDGSTDGTGEVLSSYEDRALVLRQKNRGPSAARNAGARRATGTYLAFLDSDDVWFPWTLETYADILREAGKPAFLAGCPHRFSVRIDAVGRHAAPNWISRPDYLASGDCWRWYGVSSFVVSRTEFGRLGGFAEQMRVGEDADLALRLGTSAGFVQVTSPATFAYREHAANMSAGAKALCEGAEHLIRSEQAGSYPGGSVRFRERYRILARHVRPAAIAALRAGDIRRGLSLYVRTVRLQANAGAWKFLFGFPLLAAFHALTRVIRP